MPEIQWRKKWSIHFYLFTNELTYELANELSNKLKYELTNELTHELTYGLIIFQMTFIFDPVSSIEIWYISRPKTSDDL